MRVTKITLPIFLSAFFAIGTVQADTTLAFTWSNDHGYWFACGPVQCIQVGEKTESAALDYVLSKTRHSASRDYHYTGKCHKYIVSGKIDSSDYSASKVQALSHCS